MYFLFDFIMGGLLSAMGGLLSAMGGLLSALPIKCIDAK
jgi:hypothetical protein